MSGRLSGGVASGGAGHVVSPSLPVCRVKFAIFDGDLLDPIRSSSPRRCSDTRWRSSGCRRSIQNSTGWRPRLFSRRGDRRCRAAARRRRRRARRDPPGSTRGRPARRPPPGGPGWHETLPRLASLGDVDRQTHQALPLACRIEARPPPRGDPCSLPSPPWVIRYSASTAPPVRADSSMASPTTSRSSESTDASKRSRSSYDLVRRVAEDRPSPLRDPEDAGAVVQGPEPRLGGIRGQGQARLALLQALLVALAGERVGEVLCDQPQPLHQRVRPLAGPAQGIPPDEADGSFASDRHGQAEMRLDAEVAALSRGDVGFRRELRQGRNGDHAATEDLLSDPGELLLMQRLGGRTYSHRGVGVGGRDDLRGRIRPLPEHGEIDARGVRKRGAGSLRWRHPARSPSG